MVKSPISAGSMSRMRSPSGMRRTASVKGLDVSGAIAAALARIDFASKDSLSTWSGSAVVLIKCGVNVLEDEAKRGGRQGRRFRLRPTVRLGHVCTDPPPC